MYCIYEIATGRLDSVTDQVGLVTTPPGFAVLQVADPLPGHIWDPATLNFVAPPSPRKIGKTDFINRFTTNEKRDLFGFMYDESGKTFTAAQKKNLSSLMRYLDFLDVIDLDNADIVTGVNYLQTVGILTAGRPAQVLA